MAIKKAKILDSGFSAEYWRIARLSVSRKGDGSAAMKARVELFKDKAARDAGSGSIESKQFDMELSAQESEGNQLEAVYGKLKALDEFDGASDV